ncbi:tetratricopeptide repeat protein [Salidesulfovibrio onnuriiensis]|uniref:tetratricopeptide repeat protein n=1 Tax=Salidesulfovibrio onnuriiensis TaxID=2583823 RepID=UPI00202AF538|nr:tetratricopeptide repeat protein [Salidesulfovibrio onnuriiensis]
MSRFALLLATLLLTAGCAMPTITVHEDALSPREHLQLGISYEQKKEYDLAEEQYREATDLPEAWLCLANLAFTRQQWDESEKLYEKAMKQLPEDPRPYNNLAWLYYTRKRDLCRAETLAEKAVALAPAKQRKPYEDTLESVRAARRIVELK